MFYNRNYRYWWLIYCLVSVWIRCSSRVDDLEWQEQLKNTKFGCLLDKLQWFHLATLWRTFWAHKPLKIFSCCFTCSACFVIVFFFLVDWEFLALRELLSCNNVANIINVKCFSDLSLPWYSSLLILCSHHFRHRLCIGTCVCPFTVKWSLFPISPIRVICPVTCELMLFKLTTW